MSTGLQSPEGTGKPEAKPQAGERSNKAAVPPSQLARLKDFSTVPNTYLKMVGGYVKTTEDITQASLFLVVNYGEGNWYIVTVAPLSIFPIQIQAISMPTEVGPMRRI
ncbi:hypothetical protein [Pseudomonas sp. OV546]|uniref:hypothetical protein n=1 Tax=Pseudomonas sp. OV546 TaxID=1881063 RepID=UPI0008E9BDC4|nr:hypothetical protein [Pseudomonas sp. OV546]SFV10039.1 hypothetical protein SAMN05428951_114135 [Pseudomonas sp. OV546]